MSLSFYTADQAVALCFVRPVPIRPMAHVALGLHSPPSFVPSLTITLPSLVLVAANSLLYLLCLWFPMISAPRRLLSRQVQPTSLAHWHLPLRIPLSPARVYQRSGLLPRMFGISSTQVL